MPPFRGFTKLGMVTGPTSENLTFSGFEGMATKHFITGTSNKKMNIRNNTVKADSMSVIGASLAHTSKHIKIHEFLKLILGNILKFLGHPVVNMPTNLLSIIVLHMQLTRTTIEALGGTKDRTVIGRIGRIMDDMEVEELQAVEIKVVKTRTIKMVPGKW